jgi:hypothetical protein
MVGSAYMPSSFLNVFNISANSLGAPFMAQLHRDMSGIAQTPAVIGSAYMPSSFLNVFNISANAPFPISVSNSRCNLSSAAITRNAHRFPCGFNAN